MKKHWIALALATSIASVGGLAYAASAVDNQNSVNDPKKPNSGPGVQGYPDTRTGPATRTPGGKSTDESATPGASSSDTTTQPSQDSSGVEGMPGNKNGPAAADATRKSKRGAEEPEVR